MPWLVLNEPQWVSPLSNTASSPSSYTQNWMGTSLSRILVFGVGNYDDDNHPSLCLSVICLLCWFLARPQQTWLSIRNIYIHYFYFYRQTYRQTHRHDGRQAGWHTGRRTHRHTDRHTDSQTGWLTDRHLKCWKKSVQYPINPERKKLF